MGHVGSRELIWEERGHIDPNKYQLLHFHWRQWSDHEDGYSTCSDGWTHHRLYYEDNLVLSISVLQKENVEVDRTVEGNTEFYRIKKVGICLAHIKRIVAHLSGENIKPNFNPTIVISDDEHAVLIRHPEYQKFVQEWKEREFLMFLERDNDAVRIVRLVKIEQ